MTFNSFPLDVQVCRFKVGSFNYPINKMLFLDEFIADEKNIRSVLDYNVGITKLSEAEQRYTAITGKRTIAILKYRFQPTTTSTPLSESKNLREGEDHAWGKKRGKAILYSEPTAEILKSLC